MRHLEPITRLLVLGGLVGLVLSLALTPQPAAAGGELRFLASAATSAAASAPAALSPICSSTFFCVQPSVTTSTIGAGAKKVSIFVACFDLATGSVIPNCTISFTLKPEPNTGGHAHDDPSRPTGTVSPNPGNSGASGVLEAVYTAPEISGVVAITAQGVTPDGEVLPSATATIGVELSGLVAVAVSGAGFQVLPSALHDLNNLYATPTVKAKLEALPVKFAGTLAKQGIPADQVPTLSYTSISLVAGGLFDINGTWMPPHVSHRFGLDADLRIKNVPQRFRDELREVILKSGFFFPVKDESPDDPTATHWHVRSK